MNQDTAEAVNHGSTARNSSHAAAMSLFLVATAGLVNYLHTRACGARKGYAIECFAGNARKTLNSIPEKAREVGLAQEKTNNSQALSRTRHRKPG